MKKSLMVIAIVGVLVISLGATSQAFAKFSTPSIPDAEMTGRGRGSGTGIPLEMNIALDGALEDILHGYMAEAIGVDPAALVDGNFSEVALELGYDLTEIREMVLQAHNDALVQALAEGLITQEVYDWLSVRGFATIADGLGTGMAVGMGAGSGVCTTDGVPLSDGTSQTRGYRGGK